MDYEAIAIDALESIGLTFAPPLNDTQREILANVAAVLRARTQPAPAEQVEELCDECAAVQQRLGAGCATHCGDEQRAACEKDKRDSLPVVWQLDFAATLPDGQVLEGIESEASWFLLDQTGHIWEYGPAKVPALLSKAYTRAIPMFKIAENKYMTMGEILAARHQPSQGAKDEASGEESAGEIIPAVRSAINRTEGLLVELGDCPSGSDAGEILCILYSIYAQLGARPRSLASRPVPADEKALSTRETELIDGMIAVQKNHAGQCDRIANRVMAEKQKGWDLERVALLEKIKAHTLLAHEVPKGQV